MGNGDLDRSEPRPYDSLQRPKILDGVRITGERIGKLDLRSARSERKAAMGKKVFSQLLVSPKKWQI